MIKKQEAQQEENIGVACLLSAFKMRGAEANIQEDTWRCKDRRKGKGIEDERDQTCIQQGREGKNRKRGNMEVKKGGDIEKRNKGEGSKEFKDRKKYAAGN